MFNDGLAHLSRADAFAWCAEQQLAAIEMGVGGWAKAAHQLPLDRLLREPGERDRLAGELAEHGLDAVLRERGREPAAPRPGRRPRTTPRWLRGAVELAALLGVDRVVTMSGCPGGRDGGRSPVFAPWALTPDDEPLWNWQYEQRLAPFWQELGAWARASAPAVLICLELHAGASAYSPGGYLRIAEAGGDNLRVNFDPSHFWWQGIDPLRVLDQVGDRIAFSHGKDTLLHPDRIADHGVFDFRFPVDPDIATWHFASVGGGRGVGEWSRLLAALRSAGYDGDVSIEHEDPRVRRRAGHPSVARGAAGRARPRCRSRERHHARRGPPLRRVGRRRSRTCCTTPRPVSEATRLRVLEAIERARLPAERGGAVAEAADDAARSASSIPDALNPFHATVAPAGRAARAPRRLRGARGRDRERSRDRGRRRCGRWSAGASTGSSSRP